MTNQTPEQQIDDAIERVQAAVLVASDYPCDCHDTPLDNCLDVEQAIRAELKAMHTAGRRDALEQGTEIIEQIHMLICDIGIEPEIMVKVHHQRNAWYAALATPTETKPTEETE